MYKIIQQNLSKPFSRYAQILLHTEGYKSHQCLRKLLSTISLASTEYKPKHSCSVDVDVKPPLLLIHGMLGSKSNWMSLSKRLAHDLDMKVVAIDARNHGGSPHSETMDYPSMAADVENFIRKMNYERVHLLGHSMGGRIAMNLALTHPELLSSLIIEDTMPDNVPITATFMSYLDGLLSLNLDLGGSKLGDLRQSAMLSLAKVIPNPGVRAFCLQNLMVDPKDDRRATWRCNLKAIRDSFPTLSKWNKDHVEGKQFNGPTLFIGGARSEYLSNGDYGDKDLVRSYFPSVQFTVIPGAGHWVHSENPEEFLRKLTSFMKSVC